MKKFQNCMNRGSTLVQRWVTSAVPSLICVTSKAATDIEQDRLCYFAEAAAGGCSQVRSMAIQKLLLKATRNLQLMKIAAQSADTETAETTIRNMRSMVRLQRLQKSTMKNGLAKSWLKRCGWIEAETFTFPTDDGFRSC
jgi:hypothetical protein